MGEADQEHLRLVLGASGTARIAQAIGMTENDLT
ncbi:MAG: hypothetical protein JWO94_572, partial [Verrucomicrobiaceae bacterium]|nr:hypothetical protein [Verrucomicrobiaceae bacterium]